MRTELTVDAGRLDILWLVSLLPHKRRLTLLVLSYLFFSYHLMAAQTSAICFCCSGKFLLGNKLLHKASNLWSESKGSPLHLLRSSRVSFS